ncbi:MAG: hypothetical protein AAFY64_08170, partial [Pseudomonadota bacterium]
DSKPMLTKDPYANFAGEPYNWSFEPLKTALARIERHIQHARNYMVVWATAVAGFAAAILFLNTFTLEPPKSATRSEVPAQVRNDL